MSLSPQASTGTNPEQAFSCEDREDNGKLLALIRKNGRTARLDVKGKSSHARISEMPPILTSLRLGFLSTTKNPHCIS